MPPERNERIHFREEVKVNFFNRYVILPSICLEKSICSQLDCRLFCDIWLDLHSFVKILLAASINWKEISG